MSEERDSSGLLTKAFFNKGQSDSGVKYFFSRDHLDSIREISDNSGNLQSEYSFDPYGRPTIIQETLATDWGYGQHYVHTRSGFNLAEFRGYSPTLGRWLNRDPIREKGGTNLYCYVFNNPVNRVDRSGLQSNNCLGWCCGADRTPQTPYGQNIGWPGGTPPVDFLNHYGYTCYPIGPNEPCNCVCDDQKMIVFFSGYPGYTGPTNFLNNDWDSGNIAIHAVCYNMPGNPGWTNVPDILPAWYPPEPVDPGTWSPGTGGVIYGRLCCCKKGKR